MAGLARLFYIFVLVISTGLALKNEFNCKNLCRGVGGTAVYFDQNHNCTCKTDKLLHDYERIQLHSAAGQMNLNLSLIDFSKSMSVRTDPILTQINPNIHDSELHHNLLQQSIAPGVSISAQKLPPPFARSLLDNIRSRLNIFTDKPVQQNQPGTRNPFGAVRESEAIRNSLRQITQVNVNVRPDAQTPPFWDFANRLIPRIPGLVGAPNPDYH